SGNAGDDVRGWDQQIEVMELPRAFRTTLDTIPCDVPYLWVPEERRKTSRIAPAPSRKPRIGLQWGAGDWNVSRSVPLAALRPILSFPEFEFYSFQRGVQRRQLHDFEQQCCIHDVAGDSPEILEAAADLTNI